MIDYLCSKYDLKPDRICMVGDRLDTDVVFGNSNGCKSILVLSGVTVISCPKVGETEGAGCRVKINGNSFSPLLCFPIPSSPFLSRLIPQPLLYSSSLAASSPPVQSSHILSTKRVQTEEKYQSPENKIIATEWADSINAFY